MTEIKIAISKRELERIWWDVAANGAIVMAYEAVKAEVDRRLILAGADVNQVGSELTWWDDYWRELKDLSTEVESKDDGGRKH